MAGDNNLSSTSGNSKEKESTTDKALKEMGNLIKLLPTGTAFFFRFLNPLFTNNGRCRHTINKVFTGILLVVCGFSCCFSTFTDSYVGSDGKVQYGIATIDGLWPSPASTTNSVNLSAYKLRFLDFVHAFWTVIVFAVVSLLDINTMHCYYPSFETTRKVLVMVLPPVVGFCVSAVSFVLKNKRHGIGYPAS